MPKKGQENRFEQVGLYSVHDLKGKKYDVPFFAHDDLFAKRKFTLIIKEENTIVNEFKNDFNLVRLGSFNIVTGKLYENLEIILEGKQIIDKEK